ncbi:hypothetical protein C8J56DRAFT_1110766 [Mycena floridula]|nr:hypothetical protein C8J56DRAFT_1110766 [Mycena floridula]
MKTTRQFNVKSFEEQRIWELPWMSAEREKWQCLPQDIRDFAMLSQAPAQESAQAVFVEGVCKGDLGQETDLHKGMYTIPRWITRQVNSVEDCFDVAAPLYFPIGSGVGYSCVSRHSPDLPNCGCLLRLLVLKEFGYLKSCGRYEMRFRSSKHRIITYIKVKKYNFGREMGYLGEIDNLTWTEIDGYGHTGVRPLSSVPRQCGLWLTLSINPFEIFVQSL